MEFKVNSTEVARRLEQATKVLASKSSMPILNDVLVDVKNGVMIITASDGEVWLSVKCPVISHDSDVRFCVLSHDFLEVMKCMDGQEVTMSHDIEAHQITCNLQNGHVSLPFDDAAEFPSNDNNIEDAVDVVVDGSKVLKALDMTNFAIGQSVTMPVINGTNFVFGAEGMALSSTTTFKIAIYKDKDIKTQVEGEHAMSFTLPKKPSTILSSILRATDGDIKMSFNSHSISVSNTNFKLTARLSEGRFPNCACVVPKNAPITVTIDKGLLLQALRRVIPMSDEVSNLVVMQFGQGQVTLTADNKAFGKSASMTVQCDCQQELKMGFKGTDVVEILRNIDDDNIVIELTDATRAVSFYASTTYTKDEYISVLSPSRI